MTGHRDESMDTMVRQAEADPVTALDLAAARGAVEGSALLLRVFQATGWTQRKLAEEAHVSEGRVSQVLSGEENLRVSTLARYMQAMGYRLTLSAVKRDDGAVVDARRRPILVSKPPTDASDAWSTTDEPDRSWTAEKSYRTDRVAA